MKTLLIFPPYFSPSHPYLSLPCLTAYLKEKGIHVTQADLNIDCYNYFLSPTFLANCKDKLKNSKNDIEKYKFLFDYLIEHIESAKRIFKDSTLFYDLKQYRFAKTCILQAVKLISDTFNIQSFGSILTFDEKYDLQKVLGLLEDTEQNPFLDFYCQQTFLDPAFMQYDVYGISLISDDQIIPALTLCQQIKKANPHAHITIGGNIFSKIAYKIEAFQTLFSTLFDSIILFEGEAPLYKLIRALEDNADLQSVPNLIFLDKASFVLTQTPLGEITDVNQLPAPCFDGIDFSKYFSPEPLIPYYFSRSCYWGKCAFCDHDFGYDGKYRIKSMEKIISDITHLRKAYGASVFHFVDEAIPPKILETFSFELKSMPPIHWFNCIKADNHFTEELCKTMKEAGCLAVYIGVESCSEKLLKEMDKGIDLTKIHTTLSSMNQNGIWNHVFLINNFPTETPEDKYNTLTYIMKNKDLFHAIGLSEFSLGAKSKIMHSPARYNIENTFETGQFKSFLGFSLSEGLSLKEREASTKELKDIYQLIGTNSFAANTIAYREHMPLFLKHYEFSKNRWLFSHANSHTENEDLVLRDELICKVFNERQAILFNLDQDFMYVLPSYFLSILDYFKIRRTQKESRDFFYQQISDQNRQEIVNFLNQLAIFSKPITL